MNSLRLLKKVSEFEGIYGIRQFNKYSCGENLYINAAELGFCKF